MYYSSGEPVKIGDHVWWNEYQITGHVVRILESQMDFESFGLLEPSLRICYDGSKSASGLCVTYPERALAIEEVALISEADALILEKATLSASGFFTKDIRGADFGVKFLRKEDDQVIWEVTAYRDNRVIEIVSLVGSGGMARD